MTNFRTVLKSDELPCGGLRTVQLEGEAICVVRVDDGVFAFEDRCPHRGTALSEGTLMGTTLTCSAHTWEFDVRTGRLLRLRAPACLAMRRTRLRDGMIEVGA